MKLINILGKHIHNLNTLGFFFDIKKDFYDYFFFFV